MKRILTGTLKLYKIILSPILVYLFGHACRYTPTCGEYTRQAVVKHGVLVGLFMAVKRIISCNPLTKGGFDPVPNLYR